MCTLQCGSCVCRRSFPRATCSVSIITGTAHKGTRDTHKHLRNQLFALFHFRSFSNGRASRSAKSLRASDRARLWYFMPPWHLSSPAPWRSPIFTMPATFVGVLHRSLTLTFFATSVWSWCEIYSPFRLHQHMALHRYSVVSRVHTHSL